MSKDCVLKIAKFLDFVAMQTSLKKATNWQSKISLEEGLRQSIEYFKENLENYKSELYNV
ncbi:hypothetical protein OLU63_03325 [Campylobacter jejuni]|nr:hypothetical protein [Campylobacter jejuni]